MTTYTKRIQSRLNRMGIKKSLAEIREAYTSIVNDKDNPTEAELSAVVESFMASITAIETTETASELTTIQSDDEQSPQSEEVTNNLIQPVSDSPQVKLDGTTVVANNNNNPDETLRLESDEVIEASSIVVSSDEKQDLITAQASCLGIELSEVEVVDLATSIKNSFLDHECLIEEVVTAIVTYHDHRTDRLEQKIKDAREHIEYRRKQLNQTLVGEFGEMNNFFRQGAYKRKELSKVIAAAFKT